MVKKRDRNQEAVTDAPILQNCDIGSDDEIDIVNVDFEWFNFKPEIDFHGVINLLRQLFDVDSQLFNLSGLTDLILSQPTIGSTVKVDGEETDAYAIMTILNLHQHQSRGVIQDIITYILNKSKCNPDLAPITSLLNSQAQVGLILSERLINVPAEVAPPLYNMLRDEIEAAVEDNEPYKFSHYLIFSKTYHEIASTLDQEDFPITKKKKCDKIQKEIFYFHIEDEILQKYASAFGTFDYTNDKGDQMADSKRAFSEMGIKPRGTLILIEASKFEDSVVALSNFVPSPQ